jgi:hypothetical protein
MNDETVKREEASERIIQIVARKAGKRPRQITLETRLLHDLGLYGDDAEEVLSEIEKEFHVDYGGFQFDRYFFREGFALWLAPGFLYRRLIERKQPLTVAMLVRIARGGHLRTE